MKKLVFILFMTISMVGFSQSKKEKEFKKEITELAKELDWSKKESKKAFNFYVIRYNEWKDSKQSNNKKELRKESRKKFNSNMKNLLGEERFLAYKTLVKERKESKKKKKNK